ncbi:MAG: hypothetical protein NVS9B1_04010 [Candidatus Dormibacteraceae bacterium]
MHEGHCGHDNYSGMQLLAYLVFEGSGAVGVMTIVFAVAFLGVVGLGAYVVYCDAQNRRGETSVEGHPVLAAAADPPAEHHEAEVHAIAPEPTPDVPAAPPHRRAPRPPH